MGSNLPAAVKSQRIRSQEWIIVDDMNEVSLSPEKLSELNKKVAKLIGGKGMIASSKSVLIQPINGIDGRMHEGK